MGKYWELMGFYDAETKTYSECAGTYATSPFTPSSNARLIAIRVINGNAAATTLTELQQFKLTSKSFNPNSIEVGGLGHGLATAPAFPAPILDWVVDQEVIAGVKVTIEGRNTTAETPITVETQIWGFFQD